MFYYIYGMDASEPEECAALYADLGIKAVVSPADDKCLKTLERHGIETWVCFGAFSRNGFGDDCLSEDAYGDKGEWFSSGCPNDDRLWERSLRAAVAKAADRGASAVMSDGCRFASPEPGGQMFASCFCPRCMAKGAHLGFDMEKMRFNVKNALTQPDAMLPKEWFRFREMCIKERMDELAAEAKKTGVRSGAFIFPHSLSGLVGQTPAAVASLDFIAPMLYRRYPYDPAIACLNGEYASIREIFEKRGDADVGSSIKKLTGTDIGQITDIRKEGFGPDMIYDETKAAGEAFAGCLAPILQAEDGRLAETIARCVDGGAEHIGFFAYSATNMEYIKKALLKG